MKPQDASLEVLAGVTNKFLADMVEKSTRRNNTAERTIREKLDRDIKEDLERATLCIEIMSIIACNKTK